jgi:hypothetical protein
MPQKETNNIRMTKRLLIQLVRQFDFFRFATHGFSFVLAHVGRCERSRSSSPEERPQVNHQDAFLRFANEARSRITEITPMELAKKRLRPVMIDVREEEEFLTGHISGAKHISRGSLEERIRSRCIGPNHADSRVLPARRSRSLGRRHFAKDGVPECVFFEGRAATLA